MKRIMALFFSITVFLCCCSCYSPQPIQERQYFSEYSPHEHITRIYYLTECLLEDEIKNGNIVDIYVDIVYSFYYDYPEYFLVEIAYREINEEGLKEVHGWAHPLYSKGYTYYYCEEHFGKEHQTRYRYVIGRIIQDTYVAEDVYDNGRYGRFGQSIYTEMGYRTVKKYYGYPTTMGIQKIDGIYMLHTRDNYPECSIDCGEDGEGFYLETKLSKEEIYKLRRQSELYRGSPYPAGGDKYKGLPGYAEWWKYPDC